MSLFPVNLKISVLASVIACLSFSSCRHDDYDTLSLVKKGLLSCRYHHSQFITSGDTTNYLSTSAGCAFTDGADRTLDAGNPTFNGNPMMHNDVVGEYYYFLNDSTDAFFSTSALFNINGSEDLQPFSYDAGPLHGFAIDIPYTISKSSGITFSVNIPGIFSYTEVRATIQDKDMKRVYKTFPDGNVSFSAVDLSVLSTGMGGSSLVLVEVFSERFTEANGVDLKVNYSVSAQQTVDIQ